jgi:ABC-2 type transport system ATP-binding protein
VRALHDVNLEIAPGEVFALVGPNGAGKTTLLRILATLLLPSTGSAQVNGADVVRDGRRVRHAIGLAAGDDRGFYWRLSGLENLEFFAGLLGFRRAEARHRAADALERLDLLPMAREPVGRYSTGMRQRLAIARALLGNPPVLLFDEPTRSLDPMAAGGFRTLAARLARDEGRTVVMATHNLEEAEALCRRAAILAGGTVREVVAMDGAGGLARRYRALLGAPE